MKVDKMYLINLGNSCKKKKITETMKIQILPLKRHSENKPETQ